MRGCGDLNKKHRSCGDSSQSRQQPPGERTTMAKEWGYASHNGESPTFLRHSALHRERTTTENVGEGVGLDFHYTLTKCQSRRPFFPFVLEVLPSVELLLL